MFRRKKKQTPEEEYIEKLNQQARMYEALRPPTHDVAYLPDDFRIEWTGIAANNIHAPGITADKIHAENFHLDRPPGEIDGWRKHD